MRTVMSKTTHIELVHDIAYKQKMQVCYYLEWNEEQYNTHQMQEYEKFLKIRFMGCPVEMMNEVRYSPIMAGLWKNEWIHRNANEFLNVAKDLCTESMSVNELGVLEHYIPTEFNKTTVYEEYLWCHNAMRLSNDDEFMKQFNQVIKLIIKESKKCVK